MARKKKVSKRSPKKSRKVALRGPKTVDRKPITDPARMLPEGIDVVDEVRKTHAALRQKEGGYIHPGEGSFLAHAKIGDEVVGIPRSKPFVGPEGSAIHLRRELQNLRLIQERKERLREIGGPRLRIIPTSVAVSPRRSRRKLGKTLQRIWSGEKEIDEVLSADKQKWSKHMKSVEEHLAGLKGKAKEKRARELAADSMRQLSALHNLGIAHTDIGPRHIRVGEDGKTRFMDWARALDLDKTDPFLKPMRLALDVVDLQKVFWDYVPSDELDAMLDDHYFKHLAFEVPRDSVRRTLSGRWIRRDPHAWDGAG